jgi:translation initiation factor IF-3
LRINDQIRASEVRVVDETGKQIGVMPTSRALALARERDLDLVEVAPQANPPVCRLMDYGKFKFEENHKERQNKRKQASNLVKEVKFRAKIGANDFETKTKQIVKFLEQGHRVKVSVMFRGRELSHPEVGVRLMEKVKEQVGELGRVEVEPRLDESRSNITMVLVPAKRPTSKPEAAAGNSHAWGVSSIASNAQPRSGHRREGVPVESGKEEGGA